MMKKSVSLWLAARFFMRPLLVYLLLIMLVSSCIISLFLSVSSYEYQVNQRFSSKQPHFTLTLNGSIQEWRRFIDSDDGKMFKQQLRQQDNVLAVSEFRKVRKWLRLGAATPLNRHQLPFDKFSDGEVVIVGIERQIPAVIPLVHLNYYDAGLYKLTTTNLAFAADWVQLSNTVIPNAVLDASFYPPIAQEVVISTDMKDSKGKITAFINDYNDESMLYVGIDRMSSWIEPQDVEETGLYVRLHDSRLLEKTKQQIMAHLATTEPSWLLTSWLAEKSKQKSILLMAKVMNYLLICLLLIMLTLVLMLNQTRVFINKMNSLKIFYMTGYLLTRPLSVLVLFFSILGAGVAFLLAHIVYKPFILDLFSIPADISIQPALWVIIAMVFMINLASILSLQYKWVY